MYMTGKLELQVEVPVFQEQLVPMLKLQDMQVHCSCSAIVQKTPFVLQLHTLLMLWQIRKLEYM